MMSSEAMVSFLRKMAPGVEQSLQQNETVDIFQARIQLQLAQNKNKYDGITIPGVGNCRCDCLSLRLHRRSGVVFVAIDWLKSLVLVDFTSAAVVLLLSSDIQWMSCFASSARAAARPILIRRAPPLDGRLRLMTIDVVQICSGYLLA